MSFFSAPSRALFKISFFWILYFWILRGIFALTYESSSGGATTSDLLKSLFLGAKFDVRMALFLTLPMAIIITFVSFKRLKVRKFLIKLTTFLLFIITTIMFLDFGFYSYLNTRINSSAMQFTTNPLISLQMMWETYPLLWILFGISLVTFIGNRILAKWVFRTRWQHSPLRINVISGLIFFSYLLIGIYGKIGYYPLRWSEAFYTNNQYLIALGINPILYVIDTAKVSKKSFDRKKVEDHYDVVADYLGVNNKNKDTLNFTRTIQKTPLFDGKSPNIVLIVMESFGAYKTHMMKHPLDPAPHFKALSDKGVLFNNFYTPTEGTARGIFAIVSGLPDVSSYKTASRNPLISEQNSAARALSDYEKHYFLGGSANWGEIRGVIGRSIPGITIHEEGDFSSPRVDVWGISDLNLFKEANKIFSERTSEQPFFAIIQTSGFHRPYTIPEDRKGFKLKDISDSEAKKYGFVSAAEYNSLRFQDYSLNYFLESIKDSSYFDNTIFIITADHGLADFNAQHLPEYYKHFGLSRFHSPLLFYGPKFLKPEVKNTFSSTIDILPTVAGILGKDFKTNGLGRNLFADAKNRKSFLYLYHSYPGKISLIDDQYITTGSTNNGVIGIYDYKSDTPLKNLKDEIPEKFKEMKRLNEGLYETSRYLLHNNN